MFLYSILSFSPHTSQCTLLNVTKAFPQIVAFAKCPELVFFLLQIYSLHLSPLQGFHHCFHSRRGGLYLVTIEVGAHSSNDRVLLDVLLIPCSGS